MLPRERFPLGLGFTIALATMLSGTPSPAAPNLTNISLRGLQSGGVTTLTLDGTGLLPEPRLVLPFSIAEQALRPGATATRVQFDIKLTAEVPAGIYPLRLANRGGMSAPMLIAVDSLPQLPFAPELSELPVALHGALGGATIARTQFVGKQGQRMVIEVEARRLGSAVNPVLHLYDARRVQIDWSQGINSISGDARLELELPADGRYTVELHDALYQGGNPSAYRLKLGDLRYADQVFPLAVQQGKKSILNFVSDNLPRGLTVEADALAAIADFPAPRPNLPLLSGGSPRVLLSEWPEVAEEESSRSGGPQTFEVPGAINGRLAAPGETDRYRLQVKPGAKLRFDMIAAQVGSPLDGVLMLQNEKGGQLATNDDRPTTSDPGLDFTVPAGLTTVDLVIKDLLARGGPAYIYRVAITPLGQPDFSLSVAEDRFEVPQGGAELLRFSATRAGYNGPIQLAFHGLPEGVTLSPAEIPAGATVALATLSAGELPPSQAVVQLAGRSDESSSSKTRQALVAETPATRLQPWLRGDLAVSVIAPAALSVAWANASDRAMPLGGRLPIKIKVARQEKSTGQVRLSLVTSQIVPKKNQNNQQVDDVEKALRLEAAATIDADKSEADLNVLVPASLPVMPYDLAFKAELLAADGKRVLGSAVTPVYRLTPAKVVVEAPALLAVFEDQPEFVANLTEGSGMASLFTDQKLSGSASVKVTPDQRFNPMLPGLGVKIRENPAQGEFRFLRFAWKKQGGQSICLQLNHDGKWGPEEGKPAKFRYHAGPGPECYGASQLVSETLPAEFVVVTRDLFADFGEFTLTGLALCPVDGEFALFDHLYLGRTMTDFDKVAPK